MGLLPDIGEADCADVEVKKIKEPIEKKAENKTLVAALKVLLAAYNIKQQIADIPFEGVEIGVT